MAAAGIDKRNGRIGTGTSSFAMEYPSSVAQLPQEIFEEIFDSIEDHEVQALQASSLICRAFRGLCQRRLFRRVAVSFKEPCRAPSRLHAAISASPHIVRSVRELTIAIKPASFNINTGLATDEALQREEQSATQLFHLLLPHLTTVRLLGPGTSPWSTARWDWGNLSSDLRNCFLGAFSTSPTLEAVEFHGGTISTSALRSLHPGIKSLSLINMFINTDPWSVFASPPTETRATLPVIESLAVRDLFLHPRLSPECVFGPDHVIDTSSLKDLKISLGPGGDIDEPQVLETCYQSVERLTIYDNFVSSSMVCVLAPGFDIDAWSSLRTLTLYISLANHSPTLIYPRLLSYLQHMKPPANLTRVIVNFIASSGKQFNDWAQCHLPIFDAAMTKAMAESWARLKLLRLQVLTKDSHESSPFPLEYIPSMVGTGLVVSQFSQQLYPSEFPYDATTSHPVHF